MILTSNWNTLQRNHLSSAQWTYMNYLSVICYEDPLVFYLNILITDGGKLSHLDNPANTSVKWVIINYGLSPIHTTIQTNAKFWIRYRWLDATGIWI